MSAILFLVFVLGSIGCARRYANGWTGPPGTIGQQRSSAAVYDPFPDDNAGPPVFVRPWGYRTPRAEERRVHDSPYSLNGRNR